MANTGRTKLLIALALIAVVGVAYSLYHAKKEAMLQATLAGLDLGARYGKIMPQSACLAGLKMQYAACDNNACVLGAHGFIVGCMGEAEKDGFCQSVPSPKDSKLALSWASKTCGQLQMQNTKCEEFIHKALAQCYEQNTGRKRGASELIQDGFNRGYERSR